MKGSKKYLLAAAIAAVAAAAVGVCILSAVLRSRQADLQYLRQKEYTAVFFTMVPYQNMAEDAVGEDFFSYYLGVETVAAPEYFKNANDLAIHLEAALDSGNEVSLVNLELIPFQPGSFGRLADLIAGHPDTEFQIILDAPSMGYWTAQSESGAKRQLASCRELAEELLACGNVMLYFAGAEDWLILNPDNYTAPLAANRDITKHLALMTLCDNDLYYCLTVDDYKDIFNDLEAKIEYARTAPAPADLSEWRLVFFGDSVIGNYVDSSSIPGAAAALSGCEAYNLGIGGTPASAGESGGYSFPDIVDSFIRREAVAVEEDVIFPRELEAFYEKEHSGKRLCFVVNYGLNDYFNGAPAENSADPLDTSTYAGALRAGIEKLRAVFPESVIVLAAPNYVDYFNQGQDRQGEAGGILTDYVEAAGRVARDKGVIFMDNYYDLGIDASNSWFYLGDGCHLGERGRFLYAQALIRLIWQNGNGSG